MSVVISHYMLVLEILQNIAETNWGLDEHEDVVRATMVYLHLSDNLFLVAV